MARNKEAFSEVRKAYVFERLDLTIAAAKHAVPYATATRWKKKAKVDGDCWDKARTALRLSSGGLGDLSIQVLEDFTFQYQSLMEEIKQAVDMKPQDKVDIMTKLADSFVKISAAVGKSNPQVAAVAEAIKVIDLLRQFIEEHFPQHANAFVEILTPFGDEIGRHYG